MYCEREKVGEEVVVAYFSTTSRCDLYPWKNTRHTGNLSKIIDIPEQTRTSYVLNKIETCYGCTTLLAGIIRIWVRYGRGLF
jgi:hypothetical protein